MIPPIKLEECHSAKIKLVYACLLAWYKFFRFSRWRQVRFGDKSSRTSQLREAPLNRSIPGFWKHFNDPSHQTQLLSNTSYSTDQLISVDSFTAARTNFIIMESSPRIEDENSSDLFRPSKRRKFYRKRTDGEDQASPALPFAKPPPPASMTVDELITHHAHLTETQDHNTDEEPLSVAEILRQRKAALRRKGGIEFTNSHASTSSIPQTGDALIVKEDDTPADIKSVIERFAPQTGQVSDVADKHMYAFPQPFA